MVRSLLMQCDREQQRAEEQRRRAEEQRRAGQQEEQQRQAEELRVEMLWLQLELERFKKWYYGPRADRLQSSGDVAQMLLAFSEELDRKPVPDNVPPAGEPATELRRVRRRKGRRNLAEFREPPRHHARARTGRGRTRLPVLRSPAPGDRRGRKLADRILPRPFRAPPAPAQEVRLPGLRQPRFLQALGWRVAHDGREALGGPSVSCCTKAWPHLTPWLCLPHLERQVTQSAITSCNKRERASSVTG